MQNQRRSQSTVVRASMVIAIIYVASHFFGYELENEFVEAIVVLLFAAWNVFAAYNDAKSRDKF